MYFDGLAAHYDFSLDTPFQDLPKEAQDVLLYGTGGEKLKMDYTREYGSGTHHVAFEGVLNRLVDGGNTIIVIEHNLDVIKTADHIINLGPEGGDKGGTLVACGTPEEIAACDESYTGKYLRKVLE